MLCPDLDGIHTTVHMLVRSCAEQQMHWHILLMIAHPLLALPLLSLLYACAALLAVSSQAIRCDGVPVQAGAAFPTSCSGLAADQACQGVCDNQQGLLMYVCQEDSGSWKHTGGSCSGSSSGEWRFGI